MTTEMIPKTIYLLLAAASVENTAVNDLNWNQLGQNLFLLLVGALTAWNAWRSSKRDVVQGQIHALVNSAMGAQKKTLAEVTAAKAAITHDVADVEAARVAMRDFQEHISKQSASDAGTTVKP